ncbi:MAG TPA: hypothetical protein VMV03_07440 [Spirochaetia bacterium]|nr:hypothetical protein [Spirochaetia bacterium]
MRAAPCAFLLLLLTAACFAQQAGEPAQQPRRLLVAVEASPAAGYTTGETAILAKSLALSLREAVSGIQVVEYGAAAFPSLAEARNGEALRLGADAWLLVSISGDRRAPTLRALSWDLGAQTMVLDRSFTRDGEMTALEAASEHWDDVVPLVRDAYRAGPAINLPRVERRTAALTIHVLPGTRVSGLPGGPLAADSYGVATANLEAPSSYRLRAVLYGYEPAEKEVYVDADLDLQIAQRPSAILSADTGFFNAFFMDGEVGVFFVPDTAFVKFGVTSFLLGLSVGNDSAAYSFPLLHVNLQVGWYLMPVDAWFRVYATLGGFCRVVFIPNYPVRVDALSPGGVLLGIGTEIPIAGRGRFFFEYVPMLYLSGLPDLFADSYSSGNSPGFIPLSFGAINLLNARFGIRWLL